MCDSIFFAGLLSEKLLPKSFTDSDLHPKRLSHSDDQHCNSFIVKNFLTTFNSKGKAS